MNTDQVFLTRLSTGARQLDTTMIRQTAGLSRSASQNARVGTMVKVASASNAEGWGNRYLKEVARQILTDNVVTEPPVPVQQIAQKLQV
jgi:hypothetical protein